MTFLQRILHKCFAWSAIVLAGVFLEMTPILLRSPLPHPIARFHAEPYDILLMVMRELILVMPAVAAIACAMAWHSLRRGVSDARDWAIVASACLVALSTPFFVADFTILRSYAGRTFESTGVLSLALSLLLIGIGGVAAFYKRDPQSVAAPAPHARHEVDALASSL